MNTMMKAKGFSVYTKDEIKKLHELNELVDYYKEKAMEEPDNSMNGYWFHYYNDRVVVFQKEMDRKYGFCRNMKPDSGKSLSDVLRQPMYLLAS